MSRWITPNGRVFEEFSPDPPERTSKNLANRRRIKVWLQSYETRHRCSEAWRASKRPTFC